MTSIEAAILYAGLFIILFILLKGNVGRVRSAEKIIFGDGANERLQRAQRVQGNAVEDVPVTLIGIIGLGLLSAPVLLIHGLGALFLIGRILHAVGLGGSSGGSPGRMFGTLLSLLVMLATGVGCLWYALT
ncbi:MAG TPA: glutathione S-transferase [Henriciella marina]|uniref:MAPEG family protein n=1 Tax=Henriciella sp. TaxID=1968823 RepID=UPI0017BFD591|nr:MAPEG family protein [Henriciella sp.]HIG22519.1 glutathione S-transferase [Henriciella sp.]HIK65984.1 glutathione S-transferase [Henriciella marina]